jgi:hypothetical protein
MMEDAVSSSVDPSVFQLEPQSQWLWQAMPIDLVEHILQNHRGGVGNDDGLFVLTKTSESDWYGAPCSIAHDALQRNQETDPL